MLLFMDEKAKEARRAYFRAWRRANRDKVKEYEANYWRRKAEQATETEGATDPARNEAAPATE